MRIKQLFCKHDFQIIANHQSTSQNLWQCQKCGLFTIQHWGIGVSYKCVKPNLNGWVPVKKENNHE